MSQGIEDDLEFFSVVGETLFEVGDFSGEGLDGESHAAELHEGHDDLDAHPDRPGTVEHVGGHESAVLGKGVGKETDVAFGCGHNL